MSKSTNHPGSCQHKSNHALMIVPAPLPRSENVRAEFARLSTHIHSRNVTTSAHVCQLRQYVSLLVSECKTFTSRFTFEVRKIVNKTSMQAPTMTHTTCMPGARGLSPIAVSFATLWGCATCSCAAEYKGRSRMFVHTWNHTRTLWYG